MPFDNMLVSFTCDGEFLRRIIETRVEGSRHMDSRFRSECNLFQKRPITTV